jgi:hypothetical protein
MSILRIFMYALVCLASIVAALFVQPDQSLAKQDPDPQSQEQIEARDTLHPTRASTVIAGGAHATLS